MAKWTYSAARNVGTIAVKHVGGLFYSSDWEVGMVEIRIADNVESPFCERSAEIVRVHTSLEHSLEDLINLLGELLSTLEIEYLENIWSNDLVDRTFQRLEDGSFIIRLK